MKFLFIFLSLFVSTLLFSQAPEGINYQAVMRNNSGNLVTNSTVAIRVQIRQGSATGTTVYQERQSVASSSQGLINMVIGAGTPQVGTFNNINWAVGPFFVNLGVDFSNGVNYQDFGTQQLMSVPYALFAKTSGAQLNQWRYGNTVPVNSLGFLGDFYLDVVTGNVYYKNSATTWVLTGNIKGPVGPSGATGAQGAQGIQGVAGANGTNGSNGTNGQNTLVKTTTEATGANCTTGGVKIEYGLDANNNGTLDISEINATLTKYVCNGAVGATGAQGIQGLTGTTGAQGIQGLPGTNGAIGATGPAGAQGIQGLPGTNGQSAYQAAVSNGFVGTEAQYLTSLQGAQGIQGLTGAQGIQGLTGATGAQGIQGDAGPTGPIGLTGPEGAIGAQGIQGLPGTNGTNGAVGATGPAGAQGIQGLPGTNGAIGATGPAGAQGIQGLTGAAGTNGTNGAVGATGAQGIQGLTGTNGQSAYQAAVSNGFVGTEAQWLTSLQGAQGIQGLTGVTGQAGATGTAGTNGTNGLNALIKTTTEPSGANCTNGGTKIETGLDSNGNGVLEAGEVNVGQTTFVCGSQTSAGIGLGFSNMQVFSNEGTYNWNVPSGVNKIMVEVWGAGGGGGQNCGGGGGGYGKEIISVLSNETFTITVGAGGAPGGGGGTQGVVGGTTSFGSLLSASGGIGGYDALIFADGGTSTAAYNIKGGYGNKTISGASIITGGNGANGGGGGIGGCSSRAAIAPGGGGGLFPGSCWGTAGAKGRLVIWF